MGGGDADTAAGAEYPRTIPTRLVVSLLIWYLALHASELIKKIIDVQNMKL